MQLPLLLPLPGRERARVRTDLAVAELCTLAHSNSADEALMSLQALATPCFEDSRMPA